MHTAMSFFPVLAVCAPFICFALLAILKISKNLNEDRAKNLTRSLMLFLLFGSFYNLYQHIVGFAHFGTSIKWYHFGHHSLIIALENSFHSSIFSACFIAMSTVVAFFSAPYLHKEKNIYEFYFLYFSFVASSQLTVYAANLDSVFVGWELVGICSVLLINFFRHRQKSVDSSLYTLSHYRIGEIFLLSAITMCHIIYGNKGLGFLGLEHKQVPIILLLVIGAVYVKAAQFPFGEWLPKAVEGPTPTSAIFYGGISTHLGPMLLIKLSPLLQGQANISLLIVIFGLTTFVYSAMIGRTRPDVKTQIIYASTAQLAVIFIEIGTGFYNLATFHCVINCISRTFQMLKAPSALLEHETLKIKRSSFYVEKFLFPKFLRKKLLYYSHSRFFIETKIRYFITEPFFKLANFLYGLEGHAKDFTSNSEELNKVEDKHYVPNI